MSAETPQENGPRVRIGELSRRTGVSVDALRAWERRYQLVDPVRSSGGYRLYTAADEQRVRAMRSLVEEGLSAAEAAALAKRGRPGDRTAGTVGLSPDTAVSPAPLASELLEAVTAPDEERAHRVIDRALGAFSLDTFAEGVVLPTLKEIGARWSRDELGVDQEHFATHLIRGRLLGLARGWTGGSGPLALLACPEGEQHDLGLIVFGLTLRSHGWRIALLGADTPAGVLDSAARRVRPDLIVLSSIDPARFHDSAKVLEELAGRWPLALGGAGADEELAASLGAASLTGGPVDAAERISRETSG